LWKAQSPAEKTDMMRCTTRLLSVTIAAVAVVILPFAGCAKRRPPSSNVSTENQAAATLAADDRAPMPRPNLVEPTSYQGPPLKPPQAVAQAPERGEAVLPPAPIAETSSSSSSSSSSPPAPGIPGEIGEPPSARDDYVSPSLELDPSRLMRRREEWTEAEVAADALGRIGAPAAPQIATMLDDPDPRVRRRGAEILARIGSDAEAAIPALIRLVEQDPDLQVRKAAAFALGQMGPKAAPAIPALTRMMRESSE
jgi:hypothetical protein